MRKLITLLLLLWPLFLVAQLDSTSLAYAKTQLERGKKLRKAADYTAALQLCDSALVVFSKDSLSYDTLMAQVYVERSLAYLSLERYEDAKSLAKRAVSIYDKTLGSYARAIVKPMNIVGDTYFKQGSNNLAFFYYNKVLAVMDSVATADDPYWSIMYMNLGSYYLANYDLDNSILFYNRAIITNEAKVGGAHVNLLINYFNLGAAYKISSQFEKAMLSYNKALGVYKGIGTLDSIYWSMIQCNMGDVYFEMKDVDKAYRLYEESLRPVLKKEGYQAFKSRVYRAKGKCLKERKAFAQSIFYFEKSLVAAKAKGTNSGDIIYDCYQFLSETYNEMGEREKALSLINKAFESVYFDPENPSFWNSDIDKVTLIDGMAIQAKILLDSYKENRNLETLIFAQKSNNLGLQIIDSIKLDLKEKGSHQFVTKQFYSVFENAIAIEYELFESKGDKEHLNHAFQNSENCKSNLLLDAVLKSKARTFSKVPKILLEKEEKLKSEIADTERQIYTLVNEEVNKDSSRIKYLKNQLFELKIGMQQLVEHLEQNYEAYYNLKFKSSKITLIQTQAALKNEQSSIIEYFAGDQYFYAMLINADTVKLTRLGEVEIIEPLVKKYAETVSSFRPHIINMEEHCELLSDLSFDLYEMLVAPFAALLKEEIIIIPDGILTYLSFDALIRTKPAKPWELNTYDFLMRHHTISYNYSVGLLLEKKRRKDNAKKNKLLAIAPTFKTSYQGEYLRSDELAPLQHNIKEAEAILTFCDGKLLESNSANRADFLKMATDYRAIHFATHGKANDKNGAYSYLAFSQNEENSGDDNILFAHDIYNLDLKADLVVLSACETGIGEWERGEGMISMARAFSYAGANHILTTLWKVNDSKAGILMKNYYENLQKGLGKSSALRQAKLDYLDNSKLEGSHPFFWASFISIGDDEAMLLDKPSRMWMGFVGFGAVVFLLLFGYVWRRRSRS